MAQFDVHRNPGGQKTAIPFVVVVQSRRLDDSRRRVVIPLVLVTGARETEPNLNPRFQVEQLDVVLHPLQMASVAADRLGARVASLSDHGDRIIAAIDIVISRAWG